MDYNKYNADTRKKVIYKSPGTIQKQFKEAKETSTKSIGVPEEEVTAMMEAMQAQIAELEAALIKKDAAMKAMEATKEVPEARDKKSSKTKSE